MGAGGAQVVAGSAAKCQWRVQMCFVTDWPAGFKVQIAMFKLIYSVEFCQINFNLYFPHEAGYIAPMLDVAIRTYA